MNEASEREELRALSAEVGGNPALVQAAGGNTSVKQGAVMWIKASGTWLAHARERDIMVPVDIEGLRAGLERGDPNCENCLVFVRQGLNSQGLRPSIETSVHGAMPQRVVVHVHCVETIAWAVQADAEARLAVRLKDFNWAFVPYRKPGLSLSVAIRERLRTETDVLVLGNHGLVVAGETAGEARQLLGRVVAALERPRRPAPEADFARLRRLIEGSPYRLPEDPRIHATATDSVSLKHARRGTLYPDHIVFLGPGVTVIDPAGPLPADAPPLLLVEGIGALIRKDTVAAVEPMARCLADVTARLNPEDAIRVLASSEEAALLDWDAEKYRQSLAGAALR